MAVAWSSGHTLCTINVVALHRARLVLGWVTSLWIGKPSRYVTYNPGQLSLLSLRVYIGAVHEYQRKLGRKQASTRRDALAPYPWSPTA